jgi:hypothetical protein
VYFQSVEPHFGNREASLTPEYRFEIARGAAEAMERGSWVCPFACIIIARWAE